MVDFPTLLGTVVVTVDTHALVSLGEGDEAKSDLVLAGLVEHVEEGTRVDVGEGAAQLNEVDNLIGDGSIGGEGDWEFEKIGSDESDLGGLAVAVELVAGLDERPGELSAPAILRGVPVVDELAHIGTH